MFQAQVPLAPKDDGPTTCIKALREGTHARIFHRTSLDGGGAPLEDTGIVCSAPFWTGPPARPCRSDRPYRPDCIPYPGSYFQASITERLIP